MTSLAETAFLALVVAVKWLLFTCFSINARSWGSVKGDLPFFNKSTMRRLESTPMTLKPTSAKRQAVGKPTRPHPTTLTVYFSRFSGVSMSSLASFMVTAISFPVVSLFTFVIIHVEQLCCKVNNPRRRTTTLKFNKKLFKMLSHF